MHIKIDPLSCPVTRAFEPGHSLPARYLHGWGSIGWVWLARFPEVDYIQLVANIVRDDILFELDSCLMEL